MATNTSKGSIVYKLLIVLFAVALILIILIPADIWTEEKLEKRTAQFNMSSIFEAEKFYHRLTNSYTTNKDELLSVIRSDTTLTQVQALVNHTQDLKSEMDAFLSIPYVNNLLIVDQNLNTIIEDIDENMRFFAPIENLNNAAKGFQLKLNAFKNDLNYPNFLATNRAIDSLFQLRRDLSDYNLQTVASLSEQLTGKISSTLASVEIDDFTSAYRQVAEELNNFRKDIEETALVQQTSVSARIREFSGNVVDALAAIELLDKNANIRNAEAVNAQISESYKTFLTEYYITSKTAQYNLSREDSMVLFIDEKVFMSPVTNEEYLILIADDSSDIRIESPMLLAELKELVLPIAESLQKDAFYEKYFALRDTLQVLNEKVTENKSNIRRNLEITIKTSEIKERVDKYINGAEFTAAKDLKTLTQAAGSKSFSDIKDAVENALISVGIFEQVYGDIGFVNVDSVIADLEEDIEIYNGLLDDMRRLPRGVSKISEEEIAKIDDAVSTLKEKTAITSSENLSKLRNDLGKALTFANEGKSVRVYGIFEKKLENFGFVNRTEKSWEEK